MRCVLCGFGNVVVACRFAALLAPHAWDHIAVEVVVVVAVAFVGRSTVFALIDREKVSAILGCYFFDSQGLSPVGLCWLIVQRRPTKHCTGRYRALGFRRYAAKCSHVPALALSRPCLRHLTTSRLLVGVRFLHQ
jgi:hypothetical protein